MTRAKTFIKMLTLVLKSQNICQLHLGLSAVLLFFATNHEDLDEIHPNVLISSLLKERWNQ